jgi:hypothetical protein
MDKNAKQLNLMEFHFHPEGRRFRLRKLNWHYYLPHFQLLPSCAQIPFNLKNDNLPNGSH